MSRQGGENEHDIEQQKRKTISRMTAPCHAFALITRAPDLLIAPRIVLTDTSTDNPHPRTWVVVHTHVPSPTKTLCAVPHLLTEERRDAAY